MRSMRSMRGGFIFRNRGPSLKVTVVHHGQYLTSMTKHDSGGSPPGAACDSMNYFSPALVLQADSADSHTLKGRSSEAGGTAAVPESVASGHGHGHGHGHSVEVVEGTPGTWDTSAFCWILTPCGDG
jgi:hypothetical protein